MKTVICLSCHASHKEGIDCPYCGDAGYPALLTDDNYCYGCNKKMLPHLDNDPNGQPNAICAQCTAEEAHDWDIEPDAEFSRDGSYIEKFGTWIELFRLANGTRKYRHSSTNLAFFMHPIYGTYDEGQHPCAVRADGTLNIVDKQLTDLPVA